jgi:Phosphotransferase enzyme family
MGGCTSKSPSPRISKQAKSQRFSSPKPGGPSVYTGVDGSRIRVLSKQTGSSVHQVNDDYVLKAGTRVRPAETAAMSLVQRHTDVPIPSFIHSEYDERRQQGHLWMGVVPGRTLDVVWDKLHVNTKRWVCRNIWSMIGKIRGIRRPPECQPFFQCLADGSTTHDPLIEDLNQPPRPLLSDDALRARIHERYLHYAGRRYALELPDMLPRSSSSIFTHADIAPQNIMVDSTCRITGILDWEAAGWYPEYWEYANIMRPACQFGDWQLWMEVTAPLELRCDLEGINAARRVLF